MTRKEQIYATIETFLEDNDIGKMTFPSELSAELADRIFALPIEVPGDEDIREQFPFYDEGIDLISNLDCQMGAEWMRDEIIKRNRP